MTNRIQRSGSKVLRANNAANAKRALAAWDSLTSRYTICCPGTFFSVEDKGTGERVSTHDTYAQALKAASAASEAARQLVD